jgi:hypothetical protein
MLGTKVPNQDGPFCNVVCFTHAERRYGDRISIPLVAPLVACSFHSAFESGLEHAHGTRASLLS